MNPRIWIASSAILLVIAIGEGALLLRARHPDHRLAPRLEAERPDISARSPDPLAQDPFARDPFFRDFFRDFEGLHSRFFSRFPGFDQSLGGPFQMRPLRTESIVLAPPRREDAGGEVRLVFSTRGHDKGDFSVNADDSSITLTGKDNRKDDGNGSLTESHWNFSQTFPTPSDVDPRGFRVERKNDELAVIFKRRQDVARPESAPQEQEKENPGTGFRLKYRGWGESG